MVRISHFTLTIALGGSLSMQPQVPRNASYPLLPPDAERRQQIVQSIKQYGESYVQHLPNFA